MIYAPIILIINIQCYGLQQNGPLKSTIDFNLFRSPGFINTGSSFYGIYLRLII
jgi:hypothetical protein